MVNTHFHWDHWHGNEVYPAAYPGAEIITNQLTREAMVKKGLERIQDHVRQVPAEVARLRGELAGATTTEQRAKLQADLRLAESYLAEVRALKPALPTMAFERTMKLYRRDREIHLLYLGRAHTEGDVFVYLPEGRTVITGDAVIGWTPYMGNGYPEDWTHPPSTGWPSWTSTRSSWATATRQVRLAATFRGYIHDMVEAVARRSPPARAWTRSSSGCPRAWPRPTRRPSRPTSTTGRGAPGSSPYRADLRDGELSRMAETDLFNPLSPDFHADPYPFYRRLRETDTVHQSALGFWVLTRYEDCVASLRDPRFGRDGFEAILAAQYGEERSRPPAALHALPRPARPHAPARRW